MICSCRFSCLRGMVKFPHLAGRRRPVSMCMPHIFQKWGPAVAVWCHWMWRLQYPQDFLLTRSRDEGWRQSITLTFQLVLLTPILEGTLVFSW